MTAAGSVVLKTHGFIDGDSSKPITMPTTPKIQQSAWRSNRGYSPALPREKTVPTSKDVSRLTVSMWRCRAHLGDRRRYRDASAGSKQAALLAPTARRWLWSKEVLL